MPSPGEKCRPAIASWWPRSAPSRAASILAAQEALAPSHTIDHRILDLPQAAPSQPGNAGSRAAGGAHCPAIGGQAADSRFLIDCGQVGQRQGAIDHVLWHALGAPIQDNGDRDSDALVAAARVDDHRQGTAAHPGVGACGGRGPQTGKEVSGMGVCHQGPPYLGAIGTSQALFCDGCIILNLGQKNGAQILDPGGLCKVQDGGQG